MTENGEERERERERERGINNVSEISKIT